MRKWRQKSQNFWQLKFLLQKGKSHLSLSLSLCKWLAQSTTSWNRSAIQRQFFVVFFSVAPPGFPSVINVYNNVYSQLLLLHTYGTQCLSIYFLFLSVACFPLLLAIDPSSLQLKDLVLNYMWYLFFSQRSLTTSSFYKETLEYIELKQRSGYDHVSSVVI